MNVKFWERLAMGLLVIIFISLVVGIFRDQVNYTQVIVALVGLVGVIRGVDSFSGKNGTSKKDDR